jgi:hypothetical protein
MLCKQCSFILQTKGWCTLGIPFYVEIGESDSVSDINSIELAFHYKLYCCCNHRIASSQEWFNCVRLHDQTVRGGLDEK